ncbi:MAG TPA: hypothetical protein VGM90_14450 [Kofleriaceae bacterium]
MTFLLCDAGLKCIAHATDLRIRRKAHAQMTCASEAAAAKMATKIEMNACKRI